MAAQPFSREPERSIRMQLYTSDDVRRQFDSTTYARGADYHRRKLVMQAGLEGELIKGRVRGNARTPYRQSIKLVARGAALRFEGDCSCPMAYNCKHVVAVLLAAREAVAPAAQPALPYEVSNWLGTVALHVQAAQREQQARPPAAKATFRLIYVLMPEAGGPQLRLYLCKGRIAADGAIRSATQIKDLYAFQHSPPAFLLQQDHEPAQTFIVLLKSVWGPGGLELAGENVGKLLLQLERMGALYLADDRTGLRAGLRQLRAGPARSGLLAWRAGDDGHLRLGWEFDDGAAPDGLLPVTPAQYLSGDHIGQLELPAALAALPIKAWLSLVARSPRLAPAQTTAFAQAMQSSSLNGLLPLPQYSVSVRSGVRPQAALTLRSTEQGDSALLGFVYDGLRAGADPHGELTRVGAQGIERIERHAQDEAAAWAALDAEGLRPPDGAPALAGELRLDSGRAWLRFMDEGLPRLRAQGWLIELAPGFRFDLSDIDDWYARVDEEPAGAGQDWLDLELGIVVHGQPVPLLPVLVQLIRQAPRDFEPAALEARADDEPLLATLPDGARVALPWGRVKPILRTLGELYFSDRIGSALRLPALDLARLAELEASAQLRWTGGERLRALGRKLAAFERVQPVAAPAGLQASLRPYQAEGLAWMQFLREYGLAGILADDMGLGKTIQTLSHILTEKEAGRLTAPALVVAPTSLMPNWQAEAARFTPGLRVLALTGPERLARFGDMAGADLVLTSYALLPRDEEALRQQPFHLLILDESQYIKNSRSKAAQTAGLLQARHRLCLTGTPLQNHLGELWSQFHFLMPGLLGNEQAFNADFRKPIEKLGDSGRNALLIRRIKPFLLRRTKDHVAKELPPKTEMVRMVDLAGAQRDLYETVRLAMDRKVRDEIARKGVARSQIIILDALLKLRQVCCDPRLLKVAGKRKTEAPSAKLQVLMELVDELLAEGRKLLVFSQFTSMLALIEAELQAREVPYALLTGDTVDRAAQVDAFQAGQVPLFLISLKAGGVGLNLTAADTVIHYDPWWNPAAENQATDRAWRIGQDKPVFVYRLIARGTLEEKIQELQRTKAGLADAVLAGGEMQGLQITAEDLLGVLSAE